MSALSGAVWGLATLTKTQAVFVPIIFLLVFLWGKRAMLKAGIHRRAACVRSLASPELSNFWQTLAFD